MIIRTPHTKPPFSVDLGRPVVLNDSALARWKMIHEWIKYSDVRVVVNSSFALVDRYISRSEYYQGAVYSYRFWFGTQNDRDAFIALVEQAKQDYPPNG